MDDEFGGRADHAPLFSSVRRRVGTLMLLSALGAVGALVLWFEVGVGYAALAYALTIGVLNIVVIRQVGRQSSRLHPTGTRAARLHPQSGTSPIER
ncbi:MAG TPA: hypothetical protein VMU82_07095 [Acetobacteraceae bacterium]|nr:hypothetical protein [Acetobacteraceae bacterium]